MTSSLVTVVPILTLVALLLTYLSLPTSVGVPRYNFTEALTKPAPLDPSRLYLAVYSPAEFVYQRPYEDGPTGEISRPGSTPMWAALRFINGYSPIRPAGVATGFEFFTHGEIDSDFGEYLLQSESGPSGILDQLGVDGLVVAPEISVKPEPAAWDRVLENDEGRVFHRKGAPLPAARSVTWLDSIPDREFAAAIVSNIHDSRNGMEFDVNLSAGGEPGLVTLSRPYFRGYRARLGDKKLAVNSYRGLIPIIELPAGAQGRVVVEYRPNWLIAGGAVAFLSTVAWLAGVICGFRSKRAHA
jgi:hypothetical protein